jgi:hypothetical protein
VPRCVSSARIARSSCSRCETPGAPPPGASCTRGSVCDEPQYTADVGLTRGQQRLHHLCNTSAGGDAKCVTDSPRKRLTRRVIPDFKGHHFVEDSKPGEPPSWHHCERCGMKALLRPNGSTYFDIDGTVRGLARSYSRHRILVFRSAAGMDASA